MEAIIRKMNSMVVKGGNCQCYEKKDKSQIAVNTRGMVNKLNIAPFAGGAKSKRAKLEKMKVPKLQKMAVSKGIKITKKKDGKTVYLKKATLVNKLLRK